MNHVYFIGIGGIGMSAIARYYNFKGVKVSKMEIEEWKKCMPIMI